MEYSQAPLPGPDCTAGELTPRCRLPVVGQRAGCSHFTAMKLRGNHWPAIAGGWERIRTFTPLRPPVPALRGSLSAYRRRPAREEHRRQEDGWDQGTAFHRAASGAKRAVRWSHWHPAQRLTSTTPT